MGAEIVQAVETDFVNWFKPSVAANPARPSLPEATGYSADCKASHRTKIIIIKMTEQPPQTFLPGGSENPPSKLETPEGVFYHAL